MLKPPLTTEISKLNILLPCAQGQTQAEGLFFTLKRAYKMGSIILFFTPLNRADFGHDRADFDLGFQANQKLAVVIGEP